MRTYHKYVYAHMCFMNLCFCNYTVLQAYLLVYLRMSMYHTHICICVYLCSFLYPSTSIFIFAPDSPRPCFCGALLARTPLGVRKIMEVYIYSRRQRVGIWVWEDLWWFFFFSRFLGFEDSHIPTFWLLLYVMQQSPAKFLKKRLPYATSEGTFEKKLLRCL